MALKTTTVGFRLSTLHKSWSEVWARYSSNTSFSGWLCGFVQAPSSILKGLVKFYSTLKVQAHSHLHDALCSSPLKVRFQGVWSPLCPSPICSAPLSVLCILKTTLCELDQWTPMPQASSRQHRDMEGKRLMEMGRGVSQGTPFPAPSLQHHGGQAIMVGEFPSEELQCLSTDCLHTTAPPHLPLQARGGLCTSAATRPGEPCWPLWFSSSLPTPLETGPLVKLFSGTLAGVPILGGTQALGTTVTVACWPYPIISAHASLPVLHVGHLLASLHPNSFLVLENFPLGEGPSSHDGSHKGKYSFLFPMVAGLGHTT